MPIYKRVNKNFFKKWTPEMAYILGFFAADGYITVNKRGGQFWSIQIIDKKLLESIRKCVGSEHKIGVKVGVKPNQKAFRLQIGSIEMCDDLRKLGFTENKTKSLAIPNVPKEYRAHFVRGYFDGDGHVWSGQLNKRRKVPTSVLFVAFTSSSKRFLNALLVILKGMSISGGCLSDFDSFYRLSFSTEDSLKIYEIMYNSGHCNLYLPRKKRVFDRFIVMRS